jgi:hypothetical protein
MGAPDLLFYEGTAVAQARLSVFAEHRHAPAFRVL